VIRAIPVWFSGVRFRSTLEASWAEYFSVLGLQWDYEPAALSCAPGVGWLPDFHLPQLNLFVECKPFGGPNISKPGLFSKNARRDVLIALSQGRFAYCSWFDYSRCEYEEEEEKRPGYGPICLIRQDWKQINIKMAPNSSLALDGDYHCIKWSALGEICRDMYAPDEWVGGVKDRSGSDGRDIRTYYWGGQTTWAQRGFAPSSKFKCA
jgi:hypothetical protein